LPGEALSYSADDLRLGRRELGFQLVGPPRTINLVLLLSVDRQSRGRDPPSHFLLAWSLSTVALSSVIGTRCFTDRTLIKNEPQKIGNTNFFGDNRSGKC